MSIDQPKPRFCGKERIAAFDIARGISILLVVMMHSTLGIGVALDVTTGFHPFVAFAKPFRMPDFFLLTGILAAPLMQANRCRFLNRAVVKFVYFYMLWAAIIIVIKLMGSNTESFSIIGLSYLMALIDPVGSLWYVYLLPFLFILARISIKLPRLQVVGVMVVVHLLAASALEPDPYALGSRLTGYMPLDSLMLFGVFFMVGARLSTEIQALTRWAQRHPFPVFLMFISWLALHSAGIWFGITALPGATLVFGLAGAFALLMAASLLAAVPVLSTGLAYCGRQSLALYLAFTLPMAAARIGLISTGWATSPTFMTWIVICCAVLLPLMIERITRKTAFNILFHLPDWAQIRTKSAQRLT
jgi:uncharacterized membrane protein YcfT